MAAQRDKVIANAEKLVAKGKVEAAIREYERLLDENPNDVNTLNRIGDLWVRINRNDEAVNVFARIADHYSRDGFFLKAIAIYKKINKLDPSRLDVYGKLADLYAKQGLAMEAKSQYQVLADYHLKHGDTAGALGTYRKISELDPNSVNVHVKLADLYSQNGQTAEALKEYDRLGKILLKRGMIDEAVQVFKKALKIDPSNTDLVESLVSTLLEARDYDNAIQILQSALEKNRDHPKLLAVLGRAQLAKGDLQAAQTVLQKAHQANPGDASISEPLAELYLKRQEPDRAADLIFPIADGAAARGDRSAVDILNRILRVDSVHIPTLEKLVSVYRQLNEETNILASMNSLAEAHITRGDFSDAERVLEDLVGREPENAQHQEKLAFVRQQIGGAPEPARPAAPRPRTVEQPAPAPVEQRPSMMESPELSLDLDETPALDLDLDSVTPEPPPSRPTSPSASAEPAEVDEDLDFITEHITEAEVFAKYGLSEKAVEHLRMIIDRVPSYAPALEKLLRIHMDDGDPTKVSETARSYFEVLRQAGDTDAIGTMQHELSNRGFGDAAALGRTSAAPKKVSEPEEVDAVSPAPEEELTIESEIELPEEAEEEKPEEVEFDLDALSFDDIPITPASVEPVPEEDLVPEISLDEIPGSEIEFDVELPEPADEVAETSEPIEEPIEPIEPIEELEEPEELAAEPALSDESPAFEFPTGGDEGIAFEQEASPLEEPAFEPETLEGESLEFPSAAEVSDEEFPVDEESTLEEPDAAGVEDSLAFMETDTGEPPVEELGEIDFYIEQELFDEARRKLDSLLEKYPDHPELTSRSERLDAAAFQPPKGGTPSGLSAADIETELLSAIPDEEEEVEPLPPSPPKETPAARAEAAEEEGLFAEEEDFFDLAAELEQELDEENSEMAALSEEEQSLEEIFKEFKKGVEQQLDSEDYDTHYNLGIAYKEMGLIDEAIGEFQLASKDPKRTIECCSMLGLCFLEKGMPQLAIKWYTKGLEVPEITEEEHLGLLYDLGSAYLEVGDTENAHKAFLEVYGMNSNYRDIVSRIKQLEDARP
ncbi:MAG: tetratricopeptide repeat protein [Thermoanaerobaculia bacterium]